jgi:hypothetical protein
MYVLNTGVWETKKCNIIIFFDISRQILGQYLDIIKSAYLYNLHLSFDITWGMHPGGGGFIVAFSLKLKFKKKYFVGGGAFGWNHPLKSSDNWYWNFQKIKLIIYESPRSTEGKKKNRPCDLS